MRIIIELNLSMQWIYILLSVILNNCQNVIFELAAYK